MTGAPRAVTGATRLAAVIGDPIRHSLSPALYNAAFAERALDWVFLAFEVPAGGGAAAVRAMQALGIAGLSVTMPHKVEVIEACDELSADAAALHSVNHVRVVDGRVIGDSTDGDGFMRSLADAQVEVSGRRVLMLGAGGAARAVAVALARSGAELTCAARRLDAAAEAARLCDGTAVSLDAAANLVAESDLIVNATPLGMGSDTRMPIPTSALRPGLIVADLVYHPLRTPLLLAAAAAGATTIDGLGMLVHQAAIQFEHWTGQNAPVGAMRAAALEELASRSR
jgi:shikimate dehydrogenase